MAEFDYGIEYVAIGKVLTDGGFPAIAAGELNKITNIVIDSVTREQEDDEKTEIEWEDVDGVGLILKGKKGAKTITLRSNNMSKEAYNYFMGYKTESGWTKEDPSFSLPPQFVQLKTRAVDSYPARIHQYTPCDVTVKETGTVSKNGLAELEFVIKRIANFDGEGKQIEGHRFQDVTEG